MQGLSTSLLAKFKGLGCLQMSGTVGDISYMHSTRTPAERFAIKMYLYPVCVDMYNPLHNWLL